MDELEAAVIEAAQDLVHDWIGGHYGPNKIQIQRSEVRLQDAVADLAAENDGHWTRPKELR